jgi:hypothetical protein
LHYKIITIIFISSLAFYQYGKIVDYIGCRINNLTGTVAHCDCEKFDKDLTNTSTSAHSQKSSIKEKPGDLFVNYYKKISAAIVCISVAKLKEPHMLYRINNEK